MNYVASQFVVARAPVLTRLLWCTEYFWPKPGSIRIAVTIAADAELGERDLRVVGPAGLSNRYRFFIGDLTEINEVEPNSEKSQAQRIESLPVLINGQITEGDRDYYRFAAKAGQTIVCDVQARSIVPYLADASPGWFDACLTLYDASGKRLKYVDDYRFRPDPLLVFQADKDAEYVLEIRDVVYRGRPDFVYRLSIGALPYITHIFPLGGQRGSTAQIELHGLNLPAQKVSVTIPADSPPLLHVGQSGWDGLATRPAAGLTSNTLPFAVGDLREVLEVEPNDSLEQAQKVELPVLINGRIDKPGDVDFFAFNVDKPQELVMEVHARRLESPLDSVLTLFDAKGRELAENDDTVDLENPLVTHHADSRLRYNFTAAGPYVLRIKDVQGNGGDAYAYRLSIAPPRPDFSLRVTPDNSRVEQGDTTMLKVNVLRKDGFTGEIQLAVQDLPQGFVASSAVIPPNQDQVSLTITAPDNAGLGVLAPMIVGTAKIGDQPVVRKAQAAESVMQAFSWTHIVPTKESSLAVVKSGSQPFRLVVELPQAKPLEIPQGGELQVPVKLLRKEGVKGAVTLTVVGLSQGITAKAPFIPADKDEVTVTIAAAAKAPPGIVQNMIIRGVMQVGKAEVTRVVPALPVKVIAAAK